MILDVLIMKLAEILAQITSNIIYNQAFKELARKLPKYFTRNRKMSFEYTAKEKHLDRFQLNTLTA